MVWNIVYSHRSCKLDSIDRSVIGYHEIENGIYYESSYCFIFEGYIRYVKKLVEYAKYATSMINKVI